MFVYEYGRDIVIVDCGIGFPSSSMLGADLLLPDISYLKNKLERIRGIVLTHGHYDHTEGLSYLWPQLKAPIFATRLTKGLLENRFEEFGIEAKINTIDPDKTLKLGVFNLEFVRVTHSIPDALHIILNTPIGRVYHGSDFKFDWTPVMNMKVDVEKMVSTEDKKILCLLSDCLRSEKPGYTPSEKVVEKIFESEIIDCRGKFLMTTISSNISRLQQAIDVSIKYGRKIVLVGRSITHNVEVARRLGFLDFPADREVPIQKAASHPADKLTFLVAGSQGQPDSALSRIARDEHRFVKVQSGDKVVFSSDPIPGNEVEVYSLIDRLMMKGVRVSYSDILDDIHVSGHASQNDLMLLIALTKPKYLIPIGGDFRHINQYAFLAQQMGYPQKRIFSLKKGETVEFDSRQQAALGAKLNLKTLIVDGLGIGDVGSLVLEDRQEMSQAGIALVVVPFLKGRGVFGKSRVISRGFVFIKDSTVFLKRTEKRVDDLLGRKQSSKWPVVKQAIEADLKDYFYKNTKRRPLILAVKIEA